MAIISGFHWDKRIFFSCFEQQTKFRIWKQISKVLQYNIFTSFSRFSFLSLLKNKHCFDKVSSDRDFEISAHSSPSLFLKKFSKQMKALEIVCWMSQGISFISERGQSPTLRTKCILVSTKSLIDTLSNANFSFFFLMSGWWFLFTLCRFRNL